MNLDHYKRRLSELERELIKRLGGEAGAARDANSDQAGDSDQIDEIKEEYFALVNTDAQILAEVRAALERIDDGTYGKCAIDGEPIDERRLESVPWTRCCLKHQQEIEQRAGTRTPTL